MKIVDGDLITLGQEGVFDVIVHGCNCFCAMGAGIAKSVKKAFPEAYAADVATVKGNREKLGSYSAATVSVNGADLTIINAYTQFRWNGSGVKADYEAIRSVFTEIKKHYAGKKIGYPLIGAGLAGGDWSIIEKIIDEALEGEAHTLVRFPPKAKAE